MADNINNNLANLYSPDGTLLMSGTREDIYNSHPWKTDIRTNLKTVVLTDGLILEDVTDPSKSINFMKLKK